MGDRPCHGRSEPTIRLEGQAAIFSRWMLHLLDPFRLRLENACDSLKRMANADDLSHQPHRHQQRQKYDDPRKQIRHWSRAAEVHGVVPGKGMDSNVQVHLQGNQMTARGAATRNPQLPYQVQRTLGFNAV